MEQFFKYLKERQIQKSIRVILRIKKRILQEGGWTTGQVNIVFSNLDANIKNLLEYKAKL